MFVLIAIIVFTVIIIIIILIVSKQNNWAISNHLDEPFLRRYKSGSGFENSQSIGWTPIIEWYRTASAATQDSCINGGIDYQQQCRRGLTLRPSECSFFYHGGSQLEGGERDQKRKQLIKWRVASELNYLLITATRSILALSIYFLWLEVRRSSAFPTFFWARRKKSVASILRQINKLTTKFTH